MKTPKNLVRHSLIAVLSLSVAGPNALGQQSPQQDKTDDVVRVSTELVQ